MAPWREQHHLTVGRGRSKGKQEKNGDQRKQAKRKQLPQGPMAEDASRRRKEIKVFPEADRAALRKRDMTTISWAKFLFLSITHIWHSSFLNKKLRHSILKLHCYL